MRVFITGSKGQLGAAFVRRFQANGWDYAAADLDTLDISDGNAVMAAIMPYRPALILNCAAYNLVDKAETDSAAAFAVNAEGPRLLALAARKLEATLVHYGTSYIFDGEKSSPYTETDKPSPLSNYGHSKLKGEEYALQAPGSLVLRLSWVFGQGAQNFIHKVKGWAANAGPLRVAADEVAGPTSTEDIVNVTLEALKRGLTGTWNLTNTGSCSRYDWAKLILKEYGLDKEVQPAKMSDFNLAARRPRFSAMSNEALCRELGITIPAWEEAVRAFIKETKCLK
ncbi:MAG: dTDP-4-dehydrorhamnose reductase [Elusimicrobia bacterium GWA2_61_42]|nr:MAG: dTDP-4-dehydrorhamnose reductase [Elusimicrobia bacterium GWA2_61_42]OGR76045.1 MAG: dTDP-4-dehydrorhamnose reductase [Elusimicrobia bacterium GWC2_61_25]